MPQSSHPAMRIPRLLAALSLVALPLFSLAQTGAGSTVTTPQVRAELLAHAP
jgi:hypothetical protein